jgi:hypothetical protein
MFKRFIFVISLPHSHPIFLRFTSITLAFFVLVASLFWLIDVRLSVLAQVQQLAEIIIVVKEFREEWPVLRS